MMIFHDFQLQQLQRNIALDDVTLKFLKNFPAHREIGE